MIVPTRLPDIPYHQRGEWLDRTLGSYLEERAAQSPDAPAVVQGDTRLSYGQLLRHVGQTAGGLAAAGVGRHDVVCVVLPNWWEAMVVMQSVLSMGAVVNPVVPIYRERELGFILDQARPRVVVIPHRFRRFDYVAMMETLVGALSEQITVVVVRPEGPLPPGFVAWDDLAADPPPVTPVSSSDVCLLLYTSGTTAEPKGVLHTHQTLGYEDRSIVQLLGLDRSDTIFMPSPVTHITGFLYGIVMPAMTGAPCVLLDVWDPVAAYHLIEEERCRFTLAATPFLMGLVEQYETNRRSSALRIFPCGGADVPPELVRRARDVMGTSVVRVYGSSEHPTVSCGTPADSEQVASETDGKPIGPIDTRLDDPVEGVGELLVRGPDLFLGYLDPALNEAAFTDDGFFRTGDLASIDHEGAITIRGRIKDVIVRGGEKISAREIEDLLFLHPAIREVAVVGMHDPVLVERICAYVVPEPGGAPSLDDLRTFLDQQHIARQKFPERLIIVDALPKTASGKVQKFLLRQQADCEPVDRG